MHNTNNHKQTKIPYMSHTPLVISMSNDITTRTQSLLFINTIVSSITIDQYLLDLHNIAYKILYLHIISKEK